MFYYEGGFAQANKLSTPPNTTPVETKTKNESPALASPSSKIDSTYDPRIRQSYDIIDEIKSQNVPDHFKIEFRSGLMQVFANSAGSVELNKLKSLPFVGLETVTRIDEHWGIEARGYYAKNMVFAPTGNRDRYQTIFDVGVRYRFILDQTQIDDAVILKILYHSLQNNFLLRNSSGEEVTETSDGRTGVYMKAYTGYIAGLERSIPITPKIGINAGLDLNFIQDAKSDSTTEYLKTGIGFQVRGQMTYRLDWFGMASRIGAAYWQGGMVNRFSPGAQADIEKTSHVQTFRAVSMSWIMHY